MKKLLLLISLAMLLAGCAGSSSGDVEAAKAASQAVPKSVDQLPADMPEEAKKSAAGAIQAGQEREAQMRAEGDARTKAMEGMKIQRN